MCGNLISGMRTIQIFEIFEWEQQQLGQFFEFAWSLFLSFSFVVFTFCLGILAIEYKKRLA